MSRLTDEEWELARRSCTAKQLQALAWYHRGYGYRRIAQVLGLSPSSVRDRVKRALERMLDEVERRAA